MEPAGQHNWEDNMGLFVQLVDQKGRKMVVTPRVRENFFHNFLVPLIDFMKPAALFFKEKS